MTKKWRPCAVATMWLLCIINLSSFAGAQEGVAEIAALTTALQAVKPGLDESVSNAGNQADQTLRNAQTRADYLLKAINETVGKTGGQIATQREDLARQGFTLLGEIYQDTQRTRMNVSVNLFQGLAAAASIVDAIPFVDIPDTPFASLPLALKVNGTDRRVTIYGFFPSTKGGDYATVTFDSGEKIKVYRGIGSLYFDIPAGLIKEGTFVNAQIALPQRLVPWNKDSFGTRIYILPAKPFHVSVNLLRRADDSYKDVTGQPQIIRADSGNQDNHWTKNAYDLFMASVPSHADYETDDLVFKDVSFRDVGNDKPCGCCPDSSVQLHGKSPQQVDYEVWAPSCGHCGPITNLCGGGGSHRDVEATPIFTARYAIRR